MVGAVTNRTSFVNRAVTNRTSFVNRAVTNRTSFVNRAVTNRTSFVNRAVTNRTYAMSTLLFCLLLLTSGCRNRDEESNANAIAAAPATPVEASAVLQPTFTPTAAITPTAGATATATIAPTPTVSPTPSPTPLPAEQLANGRQLHRVGNYENARTTLQQLLAIGCISVLG
jgi:hypothetical protein